MKLDSAGAVHGAFGGQIGGMGKLWGVEYAKVGELPSRHNACSPPVALLPDAKVSGSIVGLRVPLVLHIFGLRNIAKVDEPVIGRVAVDVVNDAARPASGHVHPRNPVREVNLPVNRHLNAPGRILVSDNVANESNLPYTLSSGKNTSLRIVMDKLAKAICCNIGLDHAFAPYKQWCGQRPDSVDSAVRLRHFSMGVA